MDSRAVQTDITWLKGDKPVRPKAPRMRGTQTATSVTPQQTPTRVSQAKPRRSSTKKGPVETVDRVASQRKTAVPARSASTFKGGKNSPVRVPSNEPDRLKKKMFCKKMEQDPVKVYSRFENPLGGDLVDEEMEADRVPSTF